MKATLIADKLNKSSLTPTQRQRVVRRIGLPGDGDVGRAEQWDGLMALRETIERENASRFNSLLEARQTVYRTADDTYIPR